MQSMTAPVRHSLKISAASHGIRMVIAIDGSACNVDCSNDNHANECHRLTLYKTARQPSMGHKALFCFSSVGLGDSSYGQAIFLGLVHAGFGVLLISGILFFATRTANADLITIIPISCRQQVRRSRLRPQRLRIWRRLRRVISQSGSRQPMRVG
jgi:hypothetical protein